MSSYEYQLELEASWENKYKSFRKIESEHFIFYVPKEDKVDITTQEWFYRYITTLFGVEPEEKIIYLKCKSIDVGKITGAKNLIGRACFDKKKNTIISEREWESHELVHITQMLVSESTVFFDEGLARAYQISSFDLYVRNREPLDFHRDFLHSYLQNTIIKRGYYISITKILTSKKFRAPQHEIMNLFLGITYNEAGSFVRYLIDTYGLEVFFQFLKLSDYSDSRSEIEEKLLKVYGFSVQEMEKQWLEFLKENY